jgi:hypothetical protein
VEEVDDDLLDDVEVLEALVELDVLLALVEVLLAALPEQVNTLGPGKEIPLSRVSEGSN